MDFMIMVLANKYGSRLTHLRVCAHVCAYVRACACLCLSVHACVCVCVQLASCL